MLLAIAAGFLTWVFLEIEGFHLALPMAVLVAFLDLIPLIGLTIGGFWSRRAADRRRAR